MFDPFKYTTRFIALKFAYLGQRYNGYEYAANNTTPLPTIEEVLWRALMKARLIFPTDTQAIEVGNLTWEGCDYSKCGRTDKGVSAFGQVIGLRVRSNKPPDKQSEEIGREGSCQQREGASPIEIGHGRNDRPSNDAAINEGLHDFHPIHDEIPYAQVLNRLLPEDVKVLAWCPDPPANFSARFTCRERQYRYFFTQPAFNPTFGANGVRSGLSGDSSTGQQRREGWLDIEAMKEAAKLYEGLHDFRNFCKVDASKQIERFDRRIYHSEIKEVDYASDPAAYVTGSSFTEFEGSGPLSSDSKEHRPTHSSAPKIYQFVLHGSSFLWHQVRHMIAILFLIGQGLEKPELIKHLFDIKNHPEKPQYDMAQDVPLVLWDCVFPEEGSSTREDALGWLWVGDESGAGDEDLHVTSGFKGFGKFGVGGLVDDLWKLWRKKKMQEMLAGSLLNLAVSQGRSKTDRSDETELRPSARKTYVGGDTYENRGVYIPVLERRRVEAPDVINQRWATKNAHLLNKVSRERSRVETRTDHQSDEDVG